MHDHEFARGPFARRIYRRVETGGRARLRHRWGTLPMVLLLVVAVLVAGCAGLGGGATATPEAPPPGGGSLEGTNWALTSLNGGPVFEGAEVTLQFSDGQAGGKSACNSYGGAYTAGEDGSLRFSELTRTLMACEPQAIMDLEDTYVNNLQAVTAYQIADDRLELYNQAGDTILVFARQP